MEAMAGFVLAGGRLLHLAGGSATIIGDPEHHGHLGFPVVADRIPGLGPLGGLHTVLSITPADWNLVIACDMPYLTVEVLEALLAQIGSWDAVVPRSPEGRWEPLCAVYHRRLAAAAEAALDRKSLKMQDFVSQIDARPWSAPESSVFANWNSPHELPLH